MKASPSQVGPSQDTEPHGLRHDGIVSAPVDTSPSNTVDAVAEVVDIEAPLDSGLNEDVAASPLEDTSTDTTQGKDVLEPPADVLEDTPLPLQDTTPAAEKARRWR